MAQAIQLLRADLWKRPIAHFQRNRLRSFCARRPPSFAAIGRGLFTTSSSWQVATIRRCLDCMACLSRHGAATILLLRSFTLRRRPKHDSVPGWAGQAVLEFRCIAGDWSGALHRLERNTHGGLVDRVAYRRQRAVLLTAQALSLEDNDRTQASTLALEAIKLAPSFVPAAALAGRVLTEMGEPRKAARIIETAWRANPHPDLAEAYGHLRPGDSARERLGRIQTLTARTPGNSEAALAVARAALDAQEFAIARDALAPLLDAPSKRVAILRRNSNGCSRATKAARANGWRERSLRGATPPGPPTGLFPNAGCRSHRLLAGSMLSSGRIR